LGVFAATVAIEPEAWELHHVQVVARAEKLEQKAYASSLEQRIKHLAVVAIGEVAKKNDRA